VGEAAYLRHPLLQERLVPVDRMAQQREPLDPQYQFPYAEFTAHASPSPIGGRSRVHVGCRTTRKSEQKFPTLLWCPKTGHEWPIAGTVVARLPAA
jgi:hypothetical protein